jgi:hypothetical protein
MIGGRGQIRDYLCRRLYSNGVALRIEVADLVLFAFASCFPSFQRRGLPLVFVAPVSGRN